MSYRTEVHYKAVALVEAVPFQRHLCGPDHSPALDVEEPLGSEVIGDHMLEPWRHTACLESPNKKQTLFFLSYFSPLHWALLLNSVSQSSLQSTNLCFINITVDQHLALGHVNGTFSAGRCFFADLGPMSLIQPQTLSLYKPKGQEIVPHGLYDFLEKN